MEALSPVDYLRPLRRSWALIAVTTLAAVAAALLISVLQSKTYEAKATLLVQDPNQALAVAGTSVRPTNTAAEQAEQSAQTFLTNRLLRGVRDSQEPSESVDDLRDDVSVTPSLATNLITVRAQAGDASDAAALANLVAKRGAAEQNQKVRSRFAKAAEVVNRRLRALRSSGEFNAALATGYQEQISRLETLSTVSTPVEIAQHARIPNSPVAPKPLRNALIALVLGLFLGVILAYLREAFDRTIRTRRDLEKPGFPALLGQLSKQALDDNTATDARTGIPAADVEAIRVLRANVEALNSGQAPGAVLVTSPGDREGKTSVAAALAEAFSGVSDRVCLLECDLRSPDLAARLGLPGGPGLADYLTGEARIEDVIRAAPRLGDGSANGAAASRNVSVIPAGTRPSYPAELLAGEACADLLAELKEQYEALVIDTPPLLPVADTLALLPRIDFNLLCLRIRRTTQQQAVSALAVLERHSAAPVGIVATGLTKQDSDYSPSGGLERRNWKSSSGSLGAGSGRERPTSYPGPGTAGRT